MRPTTQQGCYIINQENIRYLIIIFFNFLCFGLFVVFTVGEAYGISGLNVAKYLRAGLLQDETGAKWIVFLTKIENTGN